MPATKVEIVTDDVEAKSSLPFKSWHPEQIEALVRSTEQFPVDFDDARQWAGYSRKDSAKRVLEANFEKDLDFLLHNFVEQTGSGGHNREQIYLTIRCFKHFAVGGCEECDRCSTRCRQVVSASFASL